MKKTIATIGFAALALFAAPLASADDPAPAPKPPPLSAAGLGLHVPNLSASGLFNGGKPFAYPPLSAGGVCHYVFKAKNCGKPPA